MDGQQLDLIMRHQSMANICDSEVDGSRASDALGSSESEPATARPRGKRSRAAEVHNLSEKRRRSRINEKMKALQTLVPNSSKTDKASMLDDAIEYLKHLQLQVQMLSMRNGLYLAPSNLSGAPHLAPSEMCAANLQSGVKASNSGVGLLPVNQILAARRSYESPNHDQRHSKPIFLPTVPNATAVAPQFLQEPSQSSLQSFELTLPHEIIFQQDMMLKHRLISDQETPSVPGHKVKSVTQETSIADADNYDRISLRNEQSQDMVPKNTDAILFMPYLHCLQSGDPESDLRAGSK
ncbi:hypothetical protein PR202_ga03213 [Eleusine coracana subsp. coracana]|uniref:BHLH domain-containing protein n=1 Tax=Eleusine coracana subsp. coracana TaxID=191504 RepID=A0AAV5BNH3_ELECO|nr:hypothetical protein PR202_ga03213 [Eleusine coracana subsp. coracana]